MREWLLHAIALIAVCGAAEAQENSERARINPLARLELKDFAETTQRPLFSTTRRPPPPPAPLRHEAPPPPEPPSLTLEGVVTDQRGIHAFVKSGSPTKIRSLWRGDEVEGWKVVEIGAQDIVFERGASKFVVAMFARRSRSSKTPPRSSKGD